LLIGGSLLAFAGLAPLIVPGGSVARFASNLNLYGGSNFTFVVFCLLYFVIDLLYFVMDLLYLCSISVFKLFYNLY
jgi:hypothetical protein